MAMEGKHSPFTFKAMAYSAGGFLFAWGLTKLLDTYLDLTLLQDTKSWLLKDTAMPHWLSVSIIVLLVLTVWLAIHYDRLTSKAYGDLNEAEQTIYKLRNPEAPDLSRSQIMVLMNLANLTQRGMPTSPTFLGIGLGSGTGFEPLELEIALGHLAEKGFVVFSHSAGTSASTSTGTPSLTLKGKEFVQARRKRNAERAEQKKQSAMPESKPE